MHHHAPIPAAQPHLSLNAFSAPSMSREERNDSGEMPSLKGTLASRNKQRCGRTSAAEKREGDFGPEGFIRLVSRPLPGVTLRACPPPFGKLALLLRLRRPSGYGFQLRRTLRKCRASALGGGASRWLCHV
jgi:hypothetical protein